jgi:hypothetical protein
MVSGILLSLRFGESPWRGNVVDSAASTIKTTGYLYLRLSANATQNTSKLQHLPEDVKLFTY